MTDSHPYKCTRLDGKTSFKIRFPTDEEWITRQRGRGVLVIDLGRGKSETRQKPPTQAESDLLKAITADEFKAVVEDIQPAEAQLLLTALGEFTITDAARTGDGYEVSVTDAFGQESMFQCRVPNAEQLLNYRNTFARPIDLPFNKREIRVNLKAAGDLFSALCDQPASIMAKSQVVSAIAAEVERLAAPGIGSFEDF